MNNRIKILFFHFDLGVGGAEKVLVNLINNLPSDKYEITLCLLFNSGVRLEELAPDIQLKYLFNRKPFRGVTRFLQLFSPKFLYRRVIKEKYDIEIAYLEGIPTRILSGSSNLSSKKYAWVHSDSTRSLRSCFRSIDEAKSCYSKFDKIAFVSSLAKSHFIEFLDWDGPTEIVRNVVDSSDILRKSKEPLKIIIDRTTINLCIVGRLHVHKSHKRLIEALSHVKSKAWHLYIIGNGELKAEIEAQIRRLKLEQNITMVGFETNPYKYMSRMDAVVCSSVLEGFSTVATESMILGIPFITTDCAGMDEIVENGESGLIVENSVDGLISGLSKFITDNSLRTKLTSGARERSGNFTISQGINQFENFIL